MHYSILLLVCLFISHGAALPGRFARANNQNPQDSTTLDPSVICKGFAQDGQETPEAGQVPSLTSTNNFINFCIGNTTTNGQQITTGSCNPAPMGLIPSVDNMPSAKFVFPPNLGVVTPNKNFTIKLAINNLNTGFFVNADQNYYAAPQQLGAGGQIIGHSHVVVESFDSIFATKPNDPQKFTFFKGLNDKAQGGILTAVVAGGLPAGVYRVASINTGANHAPALAPVAQHGSMDDAVWFYSGQQAKDNDLKNQNQNPGQNQTQPKNKPNNRRRR
jgi:hypothetical protein